MRRPSDKFHLMSVFHTVVQTGAFNKAAEQMDMKPSSVSKAISQLEQLLDAKLLYRTTRNLSLTDIGNYYYDQCRHILKDVVTLEDTIGALQNEPSGTLRITAPTAFGQYFLGPRLSIFLEKYPNINIDLDLTEKLRDITKEGYDLAIRSSESLPDSSLFAMKLIAQKRVLVASPHYLEQYGQPRTPDDLSKHLTLVYSAMTQSQRWSMSNKTDQHHVSITPRLKTNSYYTLRDAARSGLGIANLNDYMVVDDIKSGRLVPVLPGYAQSQRDRFAVYQQKRDLSPKLDAFLTFLAKALRQ
ncbi:LysR family transcriptional regulator [Kiloniella majae]|uniref:LysR family transcriptional regulator n=1 Tax=Kiloniella majae TaxID=1938558 RepID=UPI000A279917|nr:LysR family transcriptional regulator [Kiloniella majae]